MPFQVKDRIHVCKGMITRDIDAHIREIYGIGESDSTASRITNKILPVVKE